MTDLTRILASRRYRQLVLGCVGLLGFFVLLARLPSIYQVKTFFTYTTRPLWDTPSGPTDRIAHYYAEGLGGSAELCALHGWPRRVQDSEIEIWDAVIFSTELDLLEIRLAELEPHTALFVVVLSTHSFTGLPRALLLPASTPAAPSPSLPAMLKPFADKLVIVHHPGRPLDHPDEDPFVLEREQRATVSQVLEREMHNRGKKEGDVIVLMGDVDEIPRRETVELLKTCRWEGPRPADGGDLGSWGKLHLQLRNYLYSFEWPTDYESWRLQAQIFAPGRSAYVHSKTTDQLLVDSGWHCSFCFRTLTEFQAKMTGYSHSDRLGSAARKLLDPDRIQRVVCSGEDIFGMWREAYRWKDFVALYTLDRSLSAVGLPRRLIEAGRERFSFLLPGGCERETGPASEPPGKHKGG